MATYSELYDLFSNSDLVNKTAVAVIKKAQAILDEASPTVAEVDWAKEALLNPYGKGEELLRYVLASNSASTVAQILAATDATIQTNVDTAVDKINTGGV